MEPRCIRANTRCRDADAHRIQLEATDRIDRRFADHDLLRFPRADPEVAGVLVRAGRQPTPCSLTGATQLGANRTIGFPGHHQKDRVAALVGIDLSRSEERFQDVRRQTTLLGKIADLDEWGDRTRRTQLVAIGAAIDAQELSKQFDACIEQD